MCTGQITSNAFTMINAFCVACRLVDEVPLLEVSPGFISSRSQEIILFSLTPLIVRIESGVSVKFGCFV